MKVNDLKHVCKDIYTELCNPNIDEIKLSDRIEWDDELSVDLGKFWQDKVKKENEWCAENGREPFSLKYGRAWDPNKQTVMLGLLFKAFIFYDEGNLQFNVRHTRDPHFKYGLKFHCYAFNNNTDVLFSKKKHDFSECTMKYDFEEGYIPDPPRQSPPIQQYNYQATPTINQQKNNSAGIGCLIASIIFFIIVLFSMF